MIFPKDIDIIKKQFDKVIRFSQGIEEPKTQKLFETWYEAKSRFIQGMNGKLIYEYPEEVSFELDEKSKKQRIDTFVQMLYNNYNYEDLADFVLTQKDGFFKNLTIEDYIYNGKKITKGTKLIKSFKYFVHNERSLEDIQNEASRIIQEDKVTGKLCISVHPLDFLSLSENNSNWRSCHSLDGEYRAGNLSYMMDSATFICYLKNNNKDGQINSFPNDVPWNDKKWRVLLFLSNEKELIMAGRQYPFTSDFGLNFILRQVLPQTHILSSARYIEYTDWMDSIYTVPFGEHTRELEESYITDTRRLYSVRDIVKEAKGSKFYNDLFYSSCYKPKYSLAHENGFGFWTLMNDQTKIELGGFTYCLHCGEKEILNGEDTMMCESCEYKYGNSDSDLFSYCEVCGDRHYTDELINVQGDWVCKSCVDKYCRKCEYCHEYVFSEDLKYIEKHDSYICPECYENYYE